MSANFNAEMSFGYDDLNLLSYALQLASMDCYGIERLNGEEDLNPETGKKLNDLLNEIQDKLGFEKFNFEPKEEEE